MLLASLDPLSPFLSLLGFTLWYRFLCLFLLFFSYVICGFSCDNSQINTWFQLFVLLIKSLSF